jgi:hypothetical protein
MNAIDALGITKSSNKEVRSHHGVHSEENKAVIDPIAIKLPGCWMYLPRCKVFVCSGFPGRRDEVLQEALG